MTRRYQKSDIDFHGLGYGSRRVPAVNVKSYGFPAVSRVQAHFMCSSKDAERALGFAYEDAQEQFWREANEEARIIFGPSVEVYSEGRSGGWLWVGGIAHDVSTWDARMVAKWGRLVRFCSDQITYLSSWNYIQEAIAANRWAEPDSERYNLIDRADGTTVTAGEVAAVERAARETFLKGDYDL